jgi:hypothetical protein
MSRAARLATLLLLSLAAACSSDAATGTDASRDERTQDAVVDADSPQVDVGAMDASERIQLTAGNCLLPACPAERCLPVGPNCNVLPCPGFTESQCPIDCEITLGCDGVPACAYPNGAEPNCGG